MNPRLASFASLYNLDTVLVRKALEGVSETDLHKRLNDSGTSLNWLVGHLVNSRYYIAHMIGGSDEYEYSNMYNGDGQPLKPAKAYPKTGELAKAFEDITVKFMKRLGELNDADIDKNVKDKWPHGENTILGAISFMLYHESWHIGQMSYLRKRLGLKGLADG